MTEPEKTVDLQQGTPDATQSLATSPLGNEATHSVIQPDSNSSRPLASSQTAVDTIGRYRVERILGEGGFGVVYLAYDDDLQRRVAIKVPQARRIRNAGDAEAYLVEAQVLARLDHPHIVPVFDVGRSQDGLPYVVSKLIEGSNLHQRIKDARPSIRESAILVAHMAEALQYAHQHRLVHRDVKPANILLDESNRPFLVDFGLALKEEDFGKESGLSGTPAYMSPEQASGEGHRVDGRSDIYSLGVVLYELLTGQRPFDSTSVSQLLTLITSAEPRPPRQLDPAIPKELERITLKALAKRASERYSTALDFADDLLHWLKPEASVDKGPVSIKIIPKGLRSFGAEDSDFFLELLPGPRDRDGLPETLRFWKNRIEQTDADQTFRVGVVYGPSGCGKSSFVKAGLLPRLANTVRVVFVEATPADTETRLLRGLEKACPELPKNLSLREAVAHLRRDECMRKKVVLVVDQFEQWLHGQHNQENAELVQALRQCDGERVQCIVMVRDDFWLAVSRFMKNLEIRVLEGQNSALVDLFDLRHAQKVLTAFGTAYGTFPDSGELTKDQETFLNLAVTGLAQEDKVISVRLALFAEMVKGKAWTPATLKEVGGTEGIGVTFLEETFSASTAPPQHRVHQQAARAVLNALLPEQGSDIKGQMRSHADLLKATGNTGRPQDFEELLAILNSEVRLITPTDPAGAVAEGEVTALGQYYQLTHDYLVPSLREWLTRKQKETRRGRAELLLADCAAVWKARPENRQLPSLLQWLQIQWLTGRKNWTPNQQKMMQQAGRFHTLRTLTTVAVLSWLLVVGYYTQGSFQSHALRDRLLDANTADVPTIVKQMAPYRHWLNPLLRSAYQQSSGETRKQLHTSLALLPVDATQVDYLYGRLLAAEPHEVPIIRDALAPHQDALKQKLWTVVATPDQGRESQRLRAAATLAKFDPQNAKWVDAQESIGNDLVAVPIGYLAVWMDSLRDVRTKLLPQLSVIYRDSARSELERSLAADVLADYAADNPQVLADLLMDAEPKQFAVILPMFKAQRDQGLPLLQGEIGKQLPSDLPSSDEQREKLALRQTNAAVALLRLDKTDLVWPLLKHSPDPRARSYLIHKLGPLGANVQTVIEHLDKETDLSIRRALLLSLGEFSEQQLPVSARESLLPKLQDMYRTDPDPGLHAAAEWLLRTWQQETWLQQTNKRWSTDEEEQSKRLSSIQELLKPGQAKTPPQWYVNSQGQTFVVIPGPVEFRMGSPEDEPDRKADEVPHQRRIGRSFALAAKSVTLAEYRSLTKDPYAIGEQYTRDPNLPVVGIDWYRAAKYCNLLSQAEGMPLEQHCYQITKPLLTGKTTYQLKANYLSLLGYRLPTDAEMEYATRAGAVTSRYFGETAELLGNYAWYMTNSQEQLWPVGLKKPNDLGLFDVQGNCDTWCQEPYGNYPANTVGQANDDREGKLEVDATERRVLRGGSFDILPSMVRSAFRNVHVPPARNSNIGFRLARTLSPAPPVP